MNGGRTLLRSPMVIVGLAIVTMLVVLAVFAPLLAPYDPHGIVGASLEGPSSSHLFGTNDIGQDIFSQIIWGARPSLIVAVGAASLAALIGALVGLTTGLLGGRIDTVTARILDVFLAVPLLPILVLVIALSSGDLAIVILVIGMIGWPFIARVLRSQALTLRQRGFIGAAQGFGAGPWYVVRRHVAPAVGPLIVVTFINLAAAAIGLQAALAFLGLGDPSSSSWGVMLNRALDFPGIYSNALWTWWVLPPGFAITLAVLGFAFLGVGLEPVFNPRLSRSATS